MKNPEKNSLIKGKIMMEELANEKLNDFEESELTS